MKVHAVLKYFEVSLVVGILLARSLTLLLAFMDIVYEIYTKIMLPPVFIVDAQGLMELFSLILLLLIGLELIATVKAFFEEEIVYVELIVLVAIIAIARKVVVWDFDKYTHNQLYSLAAMILALGVSYLLLKQGALKIPFLPRKARED